MKNDISDEEKHEKNSRVLLYTLVIIAIVFVAFLPTIMKLSMKLPADAEDDNTESKTTKYTCICDACTSNFYSDKYGYRAYQEATYTISDGTDVTYAKITKEYRFTDETSYGNYKLQVSSDLKNGNGITNTISYDDEKFVITVKTTKDIKKMSASDDPYFPRSYNNLLRWTEGQDCTSK